MDNKLVIFLNTYPPYQAGEIAGFPEDRCLELIKEKRAEFYNDKSLKVKLSKIMGKGMPKVNKG